MKIKNLQEQDLSLFFHYAQLEKWDIEEIHIRTLLKTNPDDFFIFYENSKLLGFVVALRESEEFGFISSVLVLEEFRNLGYGKMIFSFALEHLEGCQIALDSLLTQESFYEQFGFESYFDVIHYKFITGNITAKSHNYELIDFDKKLSLLGVSEYIRLLLSQHTLEYKAIKSHNTVSSYAFSFAYKDGYKITIDADNINETSTLFFALADKYDKGTNIYIQVTKLSPLLEILVQTLQMSKVSKMTRMYNKILS